MADNWSDSVSEGSGELVQVSEESIQWALRTASEWDSSNFLPNTPPDWLSAIDMADFRDRILAAKTPSALVDLREESIRATHVPHPALMELIKSRVRDFTGE